jgi:hypothetical protein
MKLPYKLELRNCFDIIKECFGVEDPNGEKHPEHKREHKRGIAELEEIIIHLAPKREKREERRERGEKREEPIRQTPKIKKIYRERLDIPVNKYLMVDASTNTDVQNEVLSSLPSDNQEYVYLE